MNTQLQRPERDAEGRATGDMEAVRPWSHLGYYSRDPIPWPLPENTCLPLGVGTGVPGHVGSTPWAGFKASQQTRTSSEVLKAQGKGLGKDWNKPKGATRETSLGTNHMLRTLYATSFDSHCIIVQDTGIIFYR